MTYKFDFSKITLGEYRSLIDPNQPEKDADEIVARVAGIEPNEITNMKFNAWRQFMRAFWKAANSAGDEKN